MGGGGTEDAICSLVVGSVDELVAGTNRVNVALKGVEDANKAAAVTADGASKAAASGERATAGLERGVLHVARRMGHLLTRLENATGIKASTVVEALGGDQGLADQASLAGQAALKGLGTATTLSRLGVPVPVAAAAGLADAAYQEVLGQIALRDKQEKEARDRESREAKDAEAYKKKVDEERRAERVRHRQDVEQRYEEQAEIARLNAAFGGARYRG